ncbi:thiolase family protein [Pseudonocardia sp. KRD-184]|uniref:Thiolase family protein n=1 Tax=Pseudonocardia oceani TaxID=2792013 RepID=A0ABS6UF61_9PSEU|nr:thiolase family protein [Pseudonocardia oceani]MBW0090154.1 thiolase family protein [Pseudonocardia oceani]MBW0097284.1 thiolase family protein [Pseudonocardia oceani]MBW0109959.1 thiolase family protein [Pseudonocardia oceani]MBW0120975.1 thiolase family protein [Pseudonocardia oceani]MBW0130882.1 thiolase family protein [Pseudonocardia oceani]
MDDALIIDAVRSPMGRGRAGGALSSVHAVELLAQTVSALLERTGVDPGAVDDVITGCVSQAGEQAGGVGRMAWLAAGLPEHVPAVTVERKCGSSQQAVHFGAQGIMSGAYDLVVVCGVESMSRVPMGSARLGADPHGPGVRRRYEPGLVSQGVSAELVAARWKLTREQQDEYAARSHALAAEVADTGRSAGELVPITTPDGAVVDADETIRRGTSAERLGGLSPAFADDDAARRFPQISWSVTAGNSSQITDGAAALLLASPAAAERLGLRPRARFAGFSVVGDDPLLMLTAPIPATRRVLARSGLRLDEIDHYEVNEAFASVPLAWQAELDADPARLNPRGGAIALGHPLGASGARLMTTMLASLESTGGRYGLQTMCEAGGMANATIVERL